LTIATSFDINRICQPQNRAKIAVALQNELRRVPKKEEIDQVFLLAGVMYKAILGLHYKRQEQKKIGQLAIS
jgi:hypothetical protein